MVNKNIENEQIKNAMNEAVNDYLAMGFIIDESSNELVKNLSRAVLIDPRTTTTRVERVIITPNEDYNLYLSEAHELPVEERIRISPILTKYSAFEATLESDELTKAEKNQVLNSNAYKAFFGKKETTESEPSAE